MWLSHRALAAYEWALLYSSTGKMHSKTTATLPVPQSLTTRTRVPEMAPKAIDPGATFLVEDI